MGSEMPRSPDKRQDENIQDRNSGTQSPGQDWQIVDDSNMSGCGSSPRSLSQKEYASELEELLGQDSPKKQEMLTADFSETDSPQVSPRSSQGELETLPESRLTHLVLDSSPDVSLPTSDQSSHAEDSDSIMFDGGQQVHVDRSRSSSEGCTDQDSDIEANLSQPVTPGSGSEHEDSTMPLGSAHSSYVSIHDVPQEDSDNATQIPAKSAPEAEEESKNRLRASQTLEEGTYARMPQGMAGATLSEWAQSEKGTMPLAGPPSQNARSQPAIAIPTSKREDSSTIDSISRRTNSLSSNTGRKNWQAWLAAGGTKASGMLHDLWNTLKGYFEQFKVMLPLKARNKAAYIMHSLQANSRHRLGSTNFALASGLVSVSMLLLWSMARNRSLARELCEKRNDLNHHIMTILDLNERLTGGMDVPIMRKCGYNSAISMGWSAGPALSNAHSAF